MVWYTIKIFQLGSLLRLAESGVGAGIAWSGLVWPGVIVVLLVLSLLSSLKKKVFPFWKVCVLWRSAAVALTQLCTHTHIHTQTHKRTHAHTRAPLSPLFLHTAFAIRLSLQEVNSEGDADADADVDVVNIAVFINVYCFCVILQ